MRINAIIFSLFCIWMVYPVHAQQKLVEKFQDKDGISQITVTKALLELMPGMISNTQMNGVNISKLINKLEQIDIFTSSYEKEMLFMQCTIEEYFKKEKSFEILMKIKDKNENIVFYAQKQGKAIDSLVMHIIGKKETILIWLQGKFTIEDVESIIEVMD